jgi:hypothetical protein
MMWVRDIFGMFARVVTGRQERVAEGCVPVRPSEWAKGLRFSQSVNRHCRRRRQIVAALIIFSASLGSLECSAQSTSIPSDFSAHLMQEDYRFQFSEQSHCSREKCPSPNGKAFAVIVPGGGEKIAAIDKATGRPTPVRGDGIVIHRADGRVVRLHIRSVSNVEQESWSVDGRYWPIPHSITHRCHRPRHRQ